MSVEGAIHSDPLWYKDAVFYEIYVRGFHDSSADGIGDFRGLTEKLDYLKWLGIDCLWLLPIYPSPLRDGGYDIKDYYSILPEYGGLEDFRDFLKAAHARGLRVIIDLVLNHTSDEHPWFRESRQFSQFSKARLVCLERERPELLRREDNFSRHRAIQLGLG